MIEIIITVLIAAFAIYILYRNITRKMSGKSECENCPLHKNGSCK